MSGIRARLGDERWRWLEVLLWSALAVQAARWIWVLAAPVGAADAPAVTASPSPRFETARVAAAFHAAGEAPSPGPDGLSLLGLRLQADSRRSAAILAGPDGRQRAYAVGDLVRAGLRLAEVAADHVLLEGAAGRHRLDLPTPAAALPGALLPSPVPPAPLPDAAPVDARQLLAEAGLRARVRDGQVRCYTLIARAGGRSLREAGLQPGDVLLAVNGDALTPERLAELGQLLQSGAGTAITVERGKEIKTITLQTEQP